MARFLTNTGDSLSLPKGSVATGSNIVLRPQNITTSREKVLNSLAGEASHREFLGSQVRYTINAGGREMVVDQSHSSGQDWYDTGSEVNLVMNTSNAVVL